MGSDLKQGFISSLRTAWQTLNEFARAHTSSALQAQLAMVADQIEEEEKQAQEGEPGGALLELLVQILKAFLLVRFQSIKSPRAPSCTGRRSLRPRSGC